MSNLKKLISFELIKASKQPINYFFVFLIIAPIIIIQAGLNSYVDKPLVVSEFIVLPMQITINTILPFLILFFSINIFSSEVKNKTLRNLLYCNSRSNIFISKIFVVTTYVTLLVILILFTTLLGYLLFNNFKVLCLKLKPNLCILHCIHTLAYTWIALGGLASFGILLSCCFKNNVSAISIGMGCYILVESVKYQLQIDKYIITSYIGQPINSLSDILNGSYMLRLKDMVNFTAISAFWIFIPLLLSFYIFRYKDVQ